MDIVLFYSKKCKISIKLLDIIQKENISNKCTLICIDDNKIKLPTNITNIPAIITKNINKPLYNNDCVDFIYNMKFFNQTTNNINKNNVIDIDIKQDNLWYNKNELSSYIRNYTVLQ